MAKTAEKEKKKEKKTALGNLLLLDKAHTNQTCRTYTFLIKRHIKSYYLILNLSVLTSRTAVKLTEIRLIKYYAY